MPVTTRSINDAIVLDLSGRFDATAKQEVKNAIEQAFESGTTHLILNLAGVPLVDSAALGLLAISHQKFKEHGGRISLVHPQPEVRIVLDMASMPTLIPSYDTLEEAIAAENPCRS